MLELLEIPFFFRIEKQENGRKKILSKFFKDNKFFIILLELTRIQFGF